MASKLKFDSNFLTSITKYNSCLGHGAFGIVLEASDNLKIVTAVKFVFPATNLATRQQMLRECNITRTLKAHDNIVQTLNVEEKELDASEIRKILDMTTSIDAAKWPPLEYLQHMRSLINYLCHHLKCRHLVFPNINSKYIAVEELQVSLNINWSKAKSIQCSSA
jgi:serine/threonine protein kinase